MGIFFSNGLCGATFCFLGAGMNKQSSHSPDGGKAALRHWAQQQRAAVNADAADKAAHAVARLFSQGIVLKENQIIAGYWPHKTELSPVPLLQQWSATGGACALPAMRGQERPLVFRHWEPGAALQRGNFGICEPAASAPEVTPGILLVPLLAFDRAGHRLGYGHGYYDRTLQALRQHSPVLSIGLGFAGQEVEGLLPSAPHDQPLDWIITEREAYCVKS